MAGQCFIVSMLKLSLQNLVKWAFKTQYQWCSKKNSTRLALEGEEYMNLLKGLVNNTFMLHSCGACWKSSDPTTLRSRRYWWRMATTFAHKLKKGSLYRCSAFFWCRLLAMTTVFSIVSIVWWNLSVCHCVWTQPTKRAKCFRRLFISAMKHGHISVFWCFHIMMVMYCNPKQQGYDINCVSDLRYHFMFTSYISLHSGDTGDLWIYQMTYYMCFSVRKKKKQQRHRLWDFKAIPSCGHSLVSSLIFVLFLAPSLSVLFSSFSCPQFVISTPITAVHHLYVFTVTVFLFASVLFCIFHKIVP